jgi:hypothetical protein
MVANTFVRRGAWRQRTLIALLAGLIVVGVVLALRNGDDRSREGGAPLERFSPEEMASLEQQAWQAYYERRWPTLFWFLFQITRDQFGLPFHEAIVPTYLGTRAQLVFAQRGDEGGEAEAYMRQFYAAVREPTGGRYDPDRAAAAEIRWWVVHRRRAEYPDTEALVDALADLSAEVYRIPVAAGRPAAEHRARAMELSDRWVRDGKNPESPLLGEIRAALLESYRALKAAVTG